MRGERPSRRTTDLTLDIRAVSTQHRSNSKLRKMSPVPSPKRADSEPVPVWIQEEETGRKEKRNTVIRASAPILTENGTQTAEPEQMSSAAEDTDGEPKKIRIKGAKAAKILGLMKEAAEARSGSPLGITSPDDIVQRTLQTASFSQQPIIEVKIPTSTLKVLPPLPAPSSPLPPTPPEVPSKRKDTIDSTHSASTVDTEGALGSESHSRATSSSAASSATVDEIETPKDEEMDPHMVRSEAKRARTKTMQSVQTIQVYADEDLLDDQILNYYQQNYPPASERRRR
jgi:hypothetical protein